MLGHEKETSTCFMSPPQRFLGIQQEYEAGPTCLLPKAYVTKTGDGPGRHSGCVCGEGMPESRGLLKINLWTQRAFAQIKDPGVTNHPQLPSKVP